MTDQHPAEDPTLGPQVGRAPQTARPASGPVTTPAASAASFSARPRRVTTTASDGRRILGPVDAAQVPRWAGTGTFARLPRLDEVEHADVVVAGMPWDTGVSYRPGARFGANHVRESSRLLRPFNPAQSHSPFAGVQVADAGDIIGNPFDIEEALAAMQAGARELTEGGTRLVTIGGDHTIALPNLRNLAERHGKIALLHFDAHLDTWDTYFGAEYTHGTPFRRAFEEDLLDTEALCHVGTRGPLYGTEDLDDDARFGFGIVSSADIYRLGVDRVVQILRERIGDRPLYVSLDIDVLDPAHAPGTGTPEAGGATSREILEILRGLRGLNLVGAEVVEVAPAYDHAELTGIAAAHIVYEFITLLSLGAGAQAGSPAYGEADAVYGDRPGRVRNDVARIVPASGAAASATPAADAAATATAEQKEV
ncbi:agmatinase [Rothia kristinae]|uniref:Agmatinase n=1 Tax=Rothia kristinae TaxID=37923 RepID=A0A7T4MS80_9MICC|nr:agmatinase [Rothia kristinae]QQC58494.1 agmatinase [Rothia kristinae]